MTYLNPGFVSTANSSSTPLAALATFTGTSEDVSAYSTITVFVDTDLDGTLYMDLSTDGTNWDRIKQVAIDQTIGSGSVHTLEVVSQYFRVRFTNDDTVSTQSHLRLQSIFNKQRSGFISSTPDQVISKADDAQIVRVSNNPFIDMSRGLYADKTVVHKFGANPLSPSGTERDVWRGGATDKANADYDWATAAETCNVTSTSLNDDASPATGAQKIVIVGLDTNFNEITETVTMDGTSNALTSNLFRRIYRAYVTDVGTYTGNNDGDITITQSSSSKLMAEIVAGVGQTEMSMYTIPAGYTGYLTHAHASVSAGTSKDATVRMYQRQNADQVSEPFLGGGKREVHEWENLQGAAELAFLAMPSFPEKTDIWWTGEGSAATGIAVIYDLMLVLNDTGTTPQ